MADEPSHTGASAPRPSLLAPDEPPAFFVLREAGRSPFLLTADHASMRVPRALGTLGLSHEDLRRHIGWDLGVEELVRCLSERLDAFAILQGYSRLVIDVNRPPGTPESIVARAERTSIPGNLGLSPEAAEARAQALFWPYHARIQRELDRRARCSEPAVLVAVHSFTPTFLGVARTVEVGILYHRDRRLAQALLSLLGEERGLVVGDNQPYSVSDETDYAIPVHGEQRGLLHVELELRQDLLAGREAIARWAERLATLLERAYQVVFPS